MPVSAVNAASNPLPVGVGKTQEEKAALGFERQLLVQLTEQLAKNAMGDSQSAATNAYKDMLPGALADAMVAAGGVGIAANLVAATKEPGK